MGEAASAVGDLAMVVRCGARCCDERVMKVCEKRTLARARTEYRARIGRRNHRRHPPSARPLRKRRRGE